MSTTNTDDDIDYSKPRRVWEPGPTDQITAWWGPITLLMVEENDLALIESRVLNQLIVRSNGGKYWPFGAQYLATKLGVQTRTWMGAAESLQDRGIIGIHIDGQHKMEFEVLWCPPWREEGDPIDRWNPPIRLGKAPKRARSGTYAKSPPDASNAPQVDSDSYASNAPQVPTECASAAQPDTFDAQDDAHDAPQLKSKAASKDVTLGTKGISPQNSDSQDDGAEPGDVITNATAAVVIAESKATLARSTPTFGTIRARTKAEIAVRDRQTELGLSDVDLYARVDIIRNLPAGAIPTTTLDGISTEDLHMVADELPNMSWLDLVPA